MGSLVGYWNAEEDDALQYLQTRTQIVYLRGIRRYADKNGIAGITRAISWKSLSEVCEVRPPPGSHEPISAPSRKAIRCDIDRLVKTGLIEVLPQSERFKGLVFKCLLAAQDQSVQMRRGQGGAKEGPWKQGPSNLQEESSACRAGGAEEGPRGIDENETEEGPASPTPSPKRIHVDSDGVNSAREADKPAKPKRTRSAKPKIPIPDDWHPSQRCYELIAQADIPQDFADGQIGEFVLYWQEQGIKRPGWDASFLSRVKQQWQWQQNQPNGKVNNHGRQETPRRSSSRQERHAAISEKLRSDLAESMAEEELGRRVIPPL